MISRCACLRFHPIGQGLFTSGRLATSNGASFNWVFDCGTSSSKSKYLDPEIARYHAGICNSPLDMLVISHFDHDHVSGISKLLKGRTVRLIVLPYLPLWFRVLLIVRLGATGSFRSFLVDPVAYLQGIAGDVDNIVFITGGAAQEPEQDFASSSEPDDNSPHDFSLSIPLGMPSDAGEFPSTDNGRLASVSIVSHASPFRIGNFWEFIFYNATPPSKVSIPQLQADVASLLKQHRATLGTFNWTKLLPDLRTIYDAYFGTSGGPRNDISLAMYSGSIASTIGGPMVGLHPHGAWVAIRPGGSSFVPAVPIHVSTGDGSYNSVAKIKALITHFTSGRWSRVSVFQVPHHGSVNSWLAPGGSSLCRHRFSIFTARTGSTDHPHPCVWADFARRQPILVSEETAFVAWGWL